MLTKRSSVVLTAIGALLCLLSVSYISCTKTGLAPKCNGVLCLNGAFCDSGVCICPTGYDGTNCGNAIVSKFIKTWDVQQTIIGSDSVKYVGQMSSYMLIFKSTATPTTFFIDNFAGNPSYNNIVCTIDSIDHSSFLLDTLQNIQQAFTYYKMDYGRGKLNADSTITAIFHISKVNQTSNFQKDTLSLIMKPHHF